MDILIIDFYKSITDICNLIIDLSSLTIDI